MQQSILFVLSTATASYRLLPEITITKPCEDELADKLAECFSEGVIKVENDNGMSYGYNVHRAPKRFISIKINILSFTCVSVFSSRLERI